MGFCRASVERAIKFRNAMRAERAERRAGFRGVPQREAFLLESSLTLEEKQHYCERKAYAQLRYFPNLDSPETYNEKLIWLALHYKNPLIAQCTDKFRMKEYVADVVGDEYVVDTFGVYDSVNDVDFDSLPSSFVLKSTAGWGSKHVILVKDKSLIDRENVKATMASWLYPWNTYYYKNMCITDEKVVPRILVEKYVMPDGDVPIDYKLLCFHGAARYLLVVTNRGSKHMTKTFVSLDSGEVLPIARNNVEIDANLRMPQEVDKLIETANKLARGFPLVRVDFMLSGERAYVGEMTFSPGLFLKINPAEWDRLLGKEIDIEKVKMECR